jgi:hypothetical protein
VITRFPALDNLKAASHATLMLEVNLVISSLISVHCFALLRSSSSRFDGLLLLFSHSKADKALDIKISSKILKFSVLV